MNHLPNETNLDILKCLNFNQLNNMQQTNRHFCNFIKEYNNELAKKVFYSMELKPNFVCKQVDHGQLPFDFKLNEELKLKWEAAIHERTQMFFMEPYQQRDFNIKYDDYDLNETANLLLVPKEKENSGPKILCFKLQRYAETIEEMLLLRYWLEQLSHCFIENVKLDQGMLNPAMIDLLFEGTPTLQLHTKYLYIYYQHFSFDGFDLLYHFVVYASKGIYVDNNSWLKVRGEKIKEEKRFYKTELEEEEGEEPKFRNVMEYDFFDVRNPAKHAVVYLCFSVDSKKYETGEIFWR